MEALTTESDTELANAIARDIGWGSNNPMKNDNAQYFMEVPMETEDALYIKAISLNELKGKRVTVHGKITFPEGKIESNVGKTAMDDTIEVGDFDFDNFANVSE